MYGVVCTVHWTYNEIYERWAWICFWGFLCFVCLTFRALCSSVSHFSCWMTFVYILVDLHESGKLAGAILCENTSIKFCIYTKFEAICKVFFYFCFIQSFAFCVISHAIYRHCEYFTVRFHNCVWFQFRFRFVWKIIEYQYMTCLPPIFKYTCAFYSSSDDGVLNEFICSYIYLVVCTCDLFDIIWILKVMSKNQYNCQYNGKLFETKKFKRINFDFDWLWSGSCNHHEIMFFCLFVVLFLY